MRRLSYKAIGLPGLRSKHELRNCRGSWKASLAKLLTAPSGTEETLTQSRFHTPNLNSLASDLADARFEGGAAAPQRASGTHETVEQRCRRSECPHAADGAPRKRGASRN